MSKLLTLAVSVGLLWASVAFAGDQPHAASQSNLKSPKSASEHWTEKAAHLEHLRRAVEHLEAAGLSELAAKVEEHAETEVLHAELAQKRNQLQKISEDIKRLERLLAGGQQELPRSHKRQQVMTRVKIVEVDLGKLQDLGLKVGADGLSGLLFDASSDDGEQKFKKLLVDQSFVKLLDWLSDNGVAKVVAEPSLVTMSGRPATFFSGGRVPLISRDGEEYSIAYRDVGTRLELLPTISEGGKIHLEFRQTLSRVVPASFTDKADGAEPDYKSQTLKAAFEVQAGQTIAVGGLTEFTDAGKKWNAQPKSFSKDKPSDSKAKATPRRTEHIFLITAEVVDATQGNVLPNFIDPTNVPRALPLPAK